ncbi:MAG: V-type ATP synthase subunit C [Lachnospiraceae bacterium]|nr:V-type ATP synthase subunit C [Lachnospiraceae bacterium]
MSKLLTYSGLSTKVKAMQSNLLSDEDFNNIIHLSNVNEVIAYLAKHPGYSKTFENADISKLHRSNLEKMLTTLKYRDFAKLYNFSNITQRKYLKLFFMKYEIALLKSVLRQIFENKTVSVDTSTLGPYFIKFSTIPIDKFEGNININEFIEILRGTLFYEPLQKIYSLGNCSLFDYELCLDVLQFTIIWKNKNKYLFGTDLELITNDYGYRIDLINIQWIYRLKTYYNLTQNEIISFLIPIRHKIKQNQMRELINSKNPAEFFEIFKNTFYGKKYKLTGENISLEHLYKTVMDDFHNKSIRNNPYSHACIDTYMHKKQNEISKLITITECIRYSYPADKILQMIK